MKKDKNTLPYGNYEKVLLHICCAPDATYPVLFLRGRHYIPVGYFYNPNIYPNEEYFKRLSETVRLSQILNFELIQGSYEFEDIKLFFNSIKGFENEKEGSKRCYLCYRFRMEKTAELAKAKGIEYFTTTISISPHKSSEWVFEIGQEMQDKYGLKFLKVDFKKRNGFKSSVILSKFFGLYRQNYCGCVFSKVSK